MFVHFSMIMLIYVSGLYVSCQICRKKFATSSTLLKHQMWHHKEMLPEFKFNCYKCAYATNIITHFKRHASVHDIRRPLQCDVCGNRFTTKNSLGSHMLIHTGDEIVY